MMFGKDFFTWNWIFAGPKTAYQRAVRNEAAAASDTADAILDALRALDGDEAFTLGALATGEEVRVAAREMGRHGEEVEGRDRRLGHVEDAEAGGVPLALGLGEIEGVRGNAERL